MENAQPSLDIANANLDRLLARIGQMPEPQRQQVVGLAESISAFVVQAGAEGGMALALAACLYACEKAKGEADAPRIVIAGSLQ